MGEADVAYNRTSDFLEPDDYVRIIDPDGNNAFFKVSRDEAMGVTRVQFLRGDAAPNDITLTVGASTGEFDAEWLSPPRENRLYQITPYFEFRWSTVVPTFPAATDSENFAPGRCVPLRQVPCSIDLLIFNPSGTRRLGVGTSETITVNTIQQTIGGINPQPGNDAFRADAVAPNYLIPLRDDLSHVFDMWTIFGSFPAFNIVNRSRVIIGGDQAGDFPVDGFLCLTGRRYMLTDVTEEEYEYLKNREPGYEYRAVTIGGVTQVTTRA